MIQKPRLGLRPQYRKEKEKEHRQRKDEVVNSSSHPNLTLTPKPTPTPTPHPRSLFRAIWVPTVFPSHHSFLYLTSLIVVLVDFPIGWKKR